MHQITVLILGPISFSSTLNELKTYLKFKPLIGELNVNHDVILFHEDALKEKKNIEIINKSNSLKIFATNSKNISNNYDAVMELPLTLREINSFVEDITVKKVFSENSSIKIKNYFLNKNEKKLLKENTEIVLTEREIQLLELLLKNNKPISKDKILSSVWNYASDADTHTVETHIYRLRKKINDKFFDNNFIINTKNGYSL
tara:strand:+ start:64 stop:669 length:606 start_codon:yes stop_codon:yes gene_type:complete